MARLDYILDDSCQEIRDLSEVIRSKLRFSYGTLGEILEIKGLIDMEDIGKDPSDATKRVLNLKLPNELMGIVNLSRTLFREVLWTKFSHYINAGELEKEKEKYYKEFNKERESEKKKSGTVSPFYKFKYAWLEKEFDILSKEKKDGNNALNDPIEESKNSNTYYDLRNFLKTFFGKISEKRESEKNLAVAYLANHFNKSLNDFLTRLDNRGVARTGRSLTEDYSETYNRKLFRYHVARLTIDNLLKETGAEKISPFFADSLLFVTEDIDKIDMPSLAFYLKNIRHNDYFALKSELLNFAKRIITNEDNALYRNIFQLRDREILRTDMTDEEIELIKQGIKRISIFEKNLEIMVNDPRVARYFLKERGKNYSEFVRLIKKIDFYLALCEGFLQNITEVKTADPRVLRNMYEKGLLIDFSREVSESGPSRIRAKPTVVIGFDMRGSKKVSKLFGDGTEGANAVRKITSVFISRNSNPITNRLVEEPPLNKPYSDTKLCKINAKEYAGGGGDDRIYIINNNYGGYIALPALDAAINIYDEQYYRLLSEEQSKLNSFAKAHSIEDIPEIGFGCGISMGQIDDETISQMNSVIRRVQQLYKGKKEQEREIIEILENRGILFDGNFDDPNYDILSKAREESLELYDALKKGNLKLIKRRLPKYMAENIIENYKKNPSLDVRIRSSEELIKEQLDSMQDCRFLAYHAVRRLEEGDATAFGRVKGFMEKFNRLNTEAKREIQNIINEVCNSYITYYSDLFFQYRPFAVYLKDKSDKFGFPLYQVLIDKDFRSLIETIAKDILISIKNKANSNRGEK